MDPPSSSRVCTKLGCPSEQGIVPSIPNHSSEPSLMQIPLKPIIPPVPHGLVDTDRCFGCGKKNPIGLRLDFTLTGKKQGAVFVASPDYQSYAGFVHGGIIATVLDEAMGNLVWKLGMKAVTGSFSVKLVKPCLVGKKYKVYGEIVKELPSKVLTKGTLKDSSGKIVAEADGIFVRVKNS